MAFILVLSLDKTLIKFKILIDSNRVFLYNLIDRQHKVDGVNNGTVCYLAWSRREAAKDPIWGRIGFCSELFKGWLQMLSARTVEFISGGLASCLAEIMTLPLDTIKVQIMLGSGGQSVWSLLSSREKVMAMMLRGLDAALVRQLLFGTLRFGLYPVFQDVWSRSDLSDTLVRVLAGFSCGAVSSAICNPTDLVKVRMQGSYAGKYRNVFSAFYTIARDEGFAALWTGVWPTVYRASVIAAVELSAFDTIKGAAADRLSLPSDGTFVVVVAALLASMFTAFLSCPFDVARSRLMNQAIEKKKKDEGSLQPPRRFYRNTLHCLYSCAREEGLTACWTGLLAWWLRLGPNAVLTFLFLSRIRSALSAWCLTS